MYCGAAITKESTAASLGMSDNDRLDVLPAAERVKPQVEGIGTFNTVFSTTDDDTVYRRSNHRDDDAFGKNSAVVIP
jgi:hypothetical protein